MLTSFQVQKLSYEFGLYDANQNGFVEKHDIEIIAKRLVANSPYENTSAEGQKLFAKVMQIWDVLTGGHDEHRRVPLTEWLKNQELALASPEGYKEANESFAEMFFELFDTDKDGKLSKSEYRNILVAFNVHTDRLDGSFTKMDLNQDGYLTKDEILQLTYEYYYSEDPNAAGNWLYGGLN